MGLEPAITVAIIAAAVSVVGWIVNYIFTSAAERRRALRASRLSHIQQQLELLYGPLAFLIYEGRRTWSDLLEKLGREHVFMQHELPKEELNLWLFWVDHDFMPRNSAIEALLASNAHLIDGVKLPDSYVAFLDHHNSWHIEHLRWKEEGIPYSWHSKENWPDQFENEVLSTFERLMGEHGRLIGVIGDPRRVS